MAFPWLLALAFTASQSFATRLIPLEGQLKRVTLVDLDRDGAVDVLVEKANALSWLAGDGAGGFAAPRLVSGASGWRSLEFLDLDGDGWLDGVGQQLSPPELVFAAGDGTGGFAAPVSVASGDWRAVGTCDLDGDGDLDLLAWERPTASLRTFRQVSGAWLPTGGFGLPGAEVLALAADDFDRDGAADVALSFWRAGAIPQTQLAVFHGDGSGSFGARWSATLPLAQRLELADLDSDGVREIVAVTSTKLFALSHQGQRHYSISPLVSTFAAQGAIADADSDGDLDLLVSTTEGARLHLNDGHGSFPEHVNLLTHPGGVGHDLADLDGDGAAEIIGPASMGRIAVTRSNGRGDWEDRHVGRSIASLPIAAGDVDGDGIDDLLLDASGTLEIARGTGPGGLVAGLVIALPTNNGAHARDLRDLDADGDVDVLLRQWTGTYEFLANDGSGSFGAHAVLPMPVDFELHWSDFDGDGVEDALSFAGASITLFRGLSGGGFAPPIVTQHGSALSFGTLADVDGNGARDVVLRRPGTGLEIWRCTNNGSFAVGSSLVWNGSTLPMTAADFDGDGFEDVVWLDRVSKLVRCARGSAAGTLSTPVDSPLLGGTDPNVQLYAVRLDADALPDLIAHAGLATTLLEPELRIALGGCRFGRPATFATGVVSRALVPIDVDGDGRRDLVTDNQGISRPLVLLQR